MKQFVAALTLLAAAGLAPAQMPGPPAPPPPPLPEVHLEVGVGGYQLWPNPDRWLCWVNSRFKATGLTPGGHYYAQVYFRPDSLLNQDFLVFNMHFYAEADGTKTWSSSITCGPVPPGGQPALCPNCMDDSGYYVIGQVKEWTAAGPGNTVCTSTVDAEGTGWVWADEQVGPYWPE